MIIIPSDEVKHLWGMLMLSFLRWWLCYCPSICIYYITLRNWYATKHSLGPLLIMLGIIVGVFLQHLVFWWYYFWWTGRHCVVWHLLHYTSSSMGIEFEINLGKSEMINIQSDPSSFMDTLGVMHMLLWKTQVRTRENV